MDPGILKYVFMNHVSQIPENFPKKLKDILTYLFKIEKQIDISFGTMMCSKGLFLHMDMVFVSPMR